MRIDRVIFSLSYESRWMSLLVGNGKPYEGFVRYLIGDGDPWHDSESDNPRSNTVTRFARDLGEKPSTVNRWFRQIYEDIHTLNDDHPELFVRDGEAQCMLSYCSHVYHDGFSFTLGLEHIPRIGEKIEFGFAAGACQTTSFTVKGVCHRLHDGKDIVDIDLAESRYSFCMDFLAEKAYILGLIGYQDRHAPQYQLDGILKKRMKY